MNSTDTLALNGGLQRNSDTSDHTSIFGSVLNALYRLQNSGKKNLGHSEASFKDISPTRGDGQTDYAKPVWQR